MHCALKADPQFYRTGLPGVIPGFPSSGNPAIVKVFFWTPQGKRTPARSSDLSSASTIDISIVVGGTGFIISALFLMIETQKNWWQPNLADLGWHSEYHRSDVSSYLGGERLVLMILPQPHYLVSFWNLVGGIGFTLCGAMGYNTDERWVDNSAISTFWGKLRIQSDSCPLAVQ